MTGSAGLLAAHCRSPRRRPSRKTVQVSLSCAPTCVGLSVGTARPRSHPSASTLPSRVCLPHPTSCRSYLSQSSRRRRWSQSNPLGLSQSIPILQVVVNAGRITCTPHPLKTSLYLVVSSRTALNRKLLLPVFKLSRACWLSATFTMLSSPLDIS